MFIYLLIAIVRNTIHTSLQGRAHRLGSPASGLLLLVGFCQHGDLKVDMDEDIACSRLLPFHNDTVHENWQRWMDKD